MEIRKRKVTFLAACLASVAGLLHAQSGWQQIKPGTSKRSDIERLVGPPVQAITDTLAEYKSVQAGDRAFVHYRSSGLAGIVDRLEILAASPLEHSAAMRTLGLTGPPEVSKPNARGKTEEYFGSALIVLTLGNTGVERYSYYSKDLFEAAGGKIGAPTAPTVNITDEVSHPSVLP